MTTLRDLDPAGRYDAGSEPARALLADLVRTPPPAPRRPTGRTVTARRAALAAALAVAIAAVGFSPALTGAPDDVVAAATRALDAGEGILHYTQRATPGDGTPQSTAEVWQTAGAERHRAIIDRGEVETAFDLEAKRMETYVRDRDEVIRHTEPDFFRPREQGALRFLSPLSSPYLVAELPGLLRRAREGRDATVEDLGEGTVRGIEVHRLKLTYELETFAAVSPSPRPPARSRPSPKVEHHMIIAVDREDFLPVRVERYGPESRFDGKVDYYGIERLPVSDEARKQLELAPHPGAKQVTEGHL